MIKPEEFWSNASPEGGCLVWKGQINPKPQYGVFQMLGGRLIAHRVAYELTHGAVPKHAHVIRTCSNPLCVKPDHLRLANSLKATHPLEDLKTKIKACIKETNGFFVSKCWEWQGDKPKSIVLPSGVRLLARGIYEVFKEPLRKSQDLKRVCNNPNCYNPDHFEAKERAEISGTNAKLTLEDVKEIRAAVLAGPINVGEMAKKYETSRQTIHAVVYNRGWHDENYNPPEKVAKIVNKPKRSIEDRFWQKVNKEGDCWTWTAYNHNGFGHFSVNHTPKMAHRVAYELAFGSIPEGMKVLHSCGNDLCMKPDHLYLEGKMAAK